MEKPGEKLNSDIFTFKYPGREPLLVEEFLSLRPDVLDLYIYDVGLSSGQLLYRCKGGIGVTKERFIVDMHKSLSIPTFSTVLRELYSEVFSDSPTRRKYISLREKFNEKSFATLDLRNSALLYLLWAMSSYTHRYRGRGYDALYLPTTPPFDKIKNASILSRKKNLLFRKEDFYTMSESIISENVVIYTHLPRTYGIYGSNFLWGEKPFKSTISMMNEFHNLGYKVCVSTPGSKYQLKYSDISNLFPSFDRIMIPGFKGSELTTEPSFSEIYFLNF
jgi:hypothetical protein